MSTMILLICSVTWNAPEYCANSCNVKWNYDENI